MMMQKRRKKQVNNIEVNNATKKVENIEVENAIKEAKENEIVFVCKSTNNKNVRANELVILEKHPENLYFIFGESNVAAKKRYYKDLETLNADFEALQKIKDLKLRKNGLEFKNRRRKDFNNIEEM